MARNDLYLSILKSEARRHKGKAAWALDQGMSRLAKIHQKQADDALRELADSYQAALPERNDHA
ncbi:hypothetical protein [Nonomuraea wenchangensis]|uniref:Uncharacterized protein n=1 Tax=Nonomuraea wenchangensis TaxID=568860 RepID=A0A1I0EZZ6_9ACTN|nr:hypothetical protein [Nonomuraea wenchangensis]SET50302.1 hypothetical protein SAMN05421811_103247 [Nonomuraea wenchangensis]